MLRPGTFALTALLAALTAVGPLSTDMYLPSLPDIAHEFHASTPQVQLTLSAFLIGFAVGQIVYGPVSDRYGRKPVLLAAVGLFCAASLACTLSTSIEMLIAARAAQALGGSGAVVLTRAIVRDLYSGVRAGRELSLIGSVMALAPVLAPIAGGALQTAFGWQAVFVVLVAAGAIAMTIAWTLLPETLAKPTMNGAPVSMLQSYRIVLSNRVYLAYLGLGSLSYAGLFAWLSGASFVLQNLYGLTPFVFGVVFAIGAVGYMIGTTIAARVVARVGLDRVAGLGSAMLAMGGLLMSLSVAVGLTSSLSLVLPVALFLAGLGMVLPQSIAGAMTPFPERAGAASSLFGFVQQAAAAACGALVAWLLGHDAWPLAAAMALTGCATLLLWLLTRGVRRAAAKF
ncbi:MAG TPA: multidrug effflux MFS transporter [Pseudolabrys sp.]|jgi:DHA1 family bicyclomycin/chloramphenicol resistance-like MFS transporter|nr:multidrug effflux MFS transporter [Pseudolabrys sp.]